MSATNPYPKEAGKGYIVGESVVFQDEVTGKYRPAKITGKERDGRQVYYVLNIDYGRIALPSQLRRPRKRNILNPIRRRTNPKGRNTLVTLAVIGGIIWGISRINN